MDDPQPTLLLVEDDSEQRKILQLVFQTGGYRVLDAENGIRALEVLEQEEIDIIVSDLMMPEMDGAELLRKVRESEKNKSLPFVVLTAVQNIEQQQAMIDLGADDYCLKGSSRKTLLRSAAKVLCLV